MREAPAEVGPMSHFAPANLGESNKPPNQNLKNTQSFIILIIPQTLTHFNGFYVFVLKKQEKSQNLTNKNYNIYIQN